MNKRREIPTITVGQLRLALSAWEDDDLLSFSGLEFNRVKGRGDHLVQIEFMEQVFLDAAGRVVVQNLE